MPFLKYKEKGIFISIYSCFQISALVINAAARRMKCNVTTSRKCGRKGPIPISTARI